MTSGRSGRPSAHLDGRANRRLLLVAIAITSGVLAVETAGGFMANSLALLSDAGHVLTDLLALVLSYTAFAISERPANSQTQHWWFTATASAMSPSTES